MHILDFYHASEHLGRVASAWYGEGTDAAREWVEARQNDLLSDCVESVIGSMRSWIPADEESRELRRLNIIYFSENKHRMRYASFAANGYHIGSGLVESACKTVVGTRLKGSGMRWGRPGAQAMLSLRAALLRYLDLDLRP